MIDDQSACGCTCAWIVQVNEGLGRHARRTCTKDMYDFVQVPRLLLPSSMMDKW